MTLQNNPPAPGWHKMALELRAPFELGAFMAALPLLLRSARGDGHAVLVFPGMLASDLSTEPLRLLLRRLGYDAQGWDLGRNIGLRPELMAASLERIRNLHHDSGRKVSLIGQSLGGIYARELAKQAPGPLTENIEVECSHQGMGVNPLVLHAVADRLAQAQGQWRPFERSGLRKFAYR